MLHIVFHFHILLQLQISVSYVSNAIYEQDNEINKYFAIQSRMLILAVIFTLYPLALSRDLV